MIALFTGGSGSGKSEMAEAFACSRAGDRKLYYFATMRVWGEEGMSPCSEKTNPTPSA